MNKIFDIHNDEIVLTEGYWATVEKNESKKLLYQWTILEEQNILNNFRICCKEKRGSFRGCNYNDAKLYKWIEAVSLHLGVAQKSFGNQENQSVLELLQEKLNESINLIIKAQTKEGYLYTYYQLVTTPKHYFKNLLLEKELYCLGCLIEAGIAHFKTTQEQLLIRCVYKAVAFLEERISLSKPIYAGDPKIEYALIQLYDLTGNQNYLNLASQMIQQRNYDKNFKKNLLKARFASKIFQLTHRSPLCQKEKQKTLFPQKLKKSIKPEEFYIINSSLKKRDFPFGNAIHYLQFRTAEIALLIRSKEKKLALPQIIEERKPFLLKEIDNLIRYHLYPNGVLGDFNKTKGFDLTVAENAKTIYGDSTTSALFVPLLKELFDLTENPLYPEIIEWIFSNTFPAAFSEDGKNYFFRQPLSWDSKDKNNSWKKIDSFFTDINIQMAKLPTLLYKEKQRDLYLLQLISNSISINRTATQIKVESNLPEGNTVEISIHNPLPQKFRLHIRIPAWAEGIEIFINGIKNDQPEIIIPSICEEWEPHFYNAHFLTIDMDEQQEEQSIKLIFSNTIRTIDEKSTDNMAIHKEIQPSGRKAFFRNSFLYYYEGAINPHMSKTAFTVNLNEPITLLEKEGELFLELTTTSMEKILLARWKNQPIYSNSHKEIWLPCKGGIGEWDYNPFSN